MGPISAISSFFYSSAASVFQPIGSVSLSSRVWAVAGLILIGLGTASAAPLQRRYDGGTAVFLPDFSSLKPLVPEFGPFYSPEFSCLTQNPVNLQNFCPNTLFPAELLARPKVCPVEVGSEFIAGNEIPREMMPYVNAAESLYPLRNRAALHFPENLSAFVFNELGLVDNGNKACRINEHPKHYIECKKNAEILMEAILEQYTDKTLKSKVYTDFAYRHHGHLLGYQGEDAIHRNFLLGINPVNHANYKNAMLEIEEKILGNDCFFKKDPEEIVGFIKKIHGILLKNLPGNNVFSDSSITPGIYRKNEVLVFRKEKEKEEIIARLKKDGATEKEIKLIKGSFSKLSYGDDFQKKLNRAELKVWKKVLYFAPPHEKVEKLMDEFAVKLKQYVQQEVHPVALAAWAHCELGRIHPFSDGNGRLSRLLLNTILVRGGYEPVIFLDDVAYTKAVNEDEWQPGIFAAYLADVIKQQAEGPQLLAAV